MSEFMSSMSNLKASLYPTMTHDDSCSLKDPINLIFEDISIDELDRVLSNAGWGSAAPSSSQHVHSLLDNVRENPHLEKSEGFILYRHHIRVWDGRKTGSGDSVGNAHLEICRLSELNKCHQVRAWESAKQYVADTFRERSYDVDDDSVNMENEMMYPIFNGRATKIGRSRN